MIPKKVLHISYDSENTWGYVIWNAISAAEKRNKAYKFSEEFRKEIGNNMLSISYRLDFLPIITNRLIEEVGKLSKIARERSKANDKYALDVSSNLIFSLLIDIDSFVFELRSVCELMEKLSKQILRFYYKKAKKNFSSELPRKYWLQSKWYKNLRELRVDIFHHVAPCIDIDITCDSKFDFLICKENIHNYRKSNRYIRLSEISNISEGFCKGSKVISEHIVRNINKFK